MTEPLVRSAGPTDAVVITGAELTVGDVEAVARHGALSGSTSMPGPGSRNRGPSSSEFVSAGEVVYGVTTGFGALAGTFIDPPDGPRLQQNLLMSHATGVGPAFPDEVVRAMLLLRANTLALGHSAAGR